MRTVKKTSLYSVINKELKEYNGKIVLYKGEYCGGSDKCHGMFEFNSKDQPVIKVAIGNKTNDQWFGVLIHEYCHFVQWRDDSPIWIAFEESNFNIDDIIKSPKKYRKQILQLIRLEVDCERKTLKLIKKHKLFCPKQYAKEANAVLYKYGFLYTHGFWPSRSPELSKSWKVCPDRIHRSYSDYLQFPEELYNIYINSRS